jgi:hypothetical protein
MMLTLDYLTDHLVIGLFLMWPNVPLNKMAKSKEHQMLVPLMAERKLATLQRGLQWGDIKREREGNICNFGDKWGTGIF